MFDHSTKLTKRKSPTSEILGVKEKKEYIQKEKISITSEIKYLSIEHNFYQLYRKDKIAYCIHDIEDHCFQSIEDIRKTVEYIVDTEVKKSRESRLAYCPHCHRMVNGQNLIKKKCKE